MWLHIVTPLAIVAVALFVAILTWGREGLKHFNNNRNEYENLTFIYRNFN
jgi:nitrogen fixation-related uncharacterized protein